MTGVRLGSQQPAGALGHIAAIAWSHRERISGAAASQQFCCGSYSKTLSLRNQTLETQRYNLAPVSYAMLETGWLAGAELRN